MTLAAWGLAILAATAETDTTIAVRPGVHLDVNNFGGDVSITSWARNFVRVTGSTDGRAQVRVESANQILSVRTTGRMGPMTPVDLNIIVPRWMDVRVASVYADVSVVGTEGEVRAETMKGDVNVKGGRGFLKLGTVQGDVMVEDARGRVEAHSVNELVRLLNVEGQVNVESVNGDIQLEHVRSDQVECSTVNGAIDYDGEIRHDGHYRFSTHNGDIGVLMPANAGASVSVATFNGEFLSSFPIRLVGAHTSRRFSFALGSGGADLELESFMGTIRLRKPGEKPEERVHEHVRQREREERNKEKEKDKDQDQEP
jgi:DUF4097 and DUF4098 domain-containing protein YvlB